MPTKLDHNKVCSVSSFFISKCGDCKIVNSALPVTFSKLGFLELDHTHFFCHASAYIIMLLVCTYTWSRLAETHRKIRPGLKWSFSLHNIYKESIIILVLNRHHRHHRHNYWNCTPSFRRVRLLCAVHRPTVNVLSDKGKAQQSWPFCWRCKITWTLKHLYRPSTWEYSFQRQSAKRFCGRDIRRRPWIFGGDRDIFGSQSVKAELHYSLRRVGTLHLRVFRAA